MDVFYPVWTDGARLAAGSPFRPPAVFSLATVALFAVDDSRCGPKVSPGSADSHGFFLDFNFHDFIPSSRQSLPVILNNFRFPCKVTV